jgi:thiol-disulfide isomerase/thioredoxin
MNMKTIFLLVISTLLLNIDLQAQHKYNIEGILKGAKGRKIYLMNIYGGLKNRDNIPPVDSVVPESDTFRFNGIFDERSYYTLSIDSSYKFKLFIIDTGRIIIEGSMDSLYRAKVRNSLQNDLFKKFYTMYNPLIDQINSAGDKGESQDSIFIRMQDSLISFTKKYPDSYISFFNAESIIRLSPAQNAKKFGKLIFPLFSDEIKLTKKGMGLKYFLYEYDSSSIIGSDFLPIKAYNVTKKTVVVKLDDKKIYLIDYWASWCTPCIEKLPELKILAAKYKNKNFEIISLSIDKSYEAWIRAIQKHKIPWGNYSGLNGIETEDAKYFNITSIPYTILVGKGNKIIKLNPTEEAVEEYLKEHLD